MCLFLTIHLLGNLQLFLPSDQARGQFNWYADLLSHSLLIEAAAIGTYLAILAHTLLALVTTLRNRRAAGSGYEASAPATAAPWYSRSMGILGVVILVFLIVHMTDFWFPYKTGADIGIDDHGRRDLYGLVAVKFQQGWRIVLYEAGVLAVGFHLLHGFYSGLRSLGVHHHGYATGLRWLGYAFTVALTIGFGAMPVYMYFYYK